MSNFELSGGCTKCGKKTLSQRKLLYLPHCDEVTPGVQDVSVSSQTGVLKGAKRDDYVEWTEGAIKVRQGKLLWSHGGYL